jgi:hypothetical protein
MDMPHHPSPVHLIAIDMDGTLLNPAHKLTPRVKQAIAAARAQGVRVVLASGRPVSGLAPFLGELGIEGDAEFCIACNGAVVAPALACSVTTGAAWGCGAAARGAGALPVVPRFSRAEYVASSRRSRKATTSEDGAVFRRPSRIIRGVVFWP